MLSCGPLSGREVWFTVFVLAFENVNVGVVRMPVRLVLCSFFGFGIVEVKPQAGDFIDGFIAVCEVVFLNRDHTLVVP
jgi:hypothetical protein